MNPRTRPRSIPPGLASAIEEVSVRDVQYTLQVEDVDRADELYHLRLARNMQAAWTAFNYLREAQHRMSSSHPMAASWKWAPFTRSARHLEIPVVTYEFGEQRERIWLAQNGEVMRQETGCPVGSAPATSPLDEEQWEQACASCTHPASAPTCGRISPAAGRACPARAASRRARLWAWTAGRWCSLAANVIGDSLTLGRQVFTPA